MIRIEKGDPPASLIESGCAHAIEMCEDYVRDPEGYELGYRKFKPRASIYASVEVKATLHATHYGKCCYCETFIERPYAHPHVEHWRPKACSQQCKRRPKMWPGYYWLAYSWENLFWSCHFCNSSNKGNLFPLVNPAKRARYHGMALEDETPAILKPDG